MPHFIIRNGGLYQYPRRPSGPRYPKVYMQRTVYGPDIGQAHVFTTRTAAKNSSGGQDGVVEVELRIKRDGEEEAYTGTGGDPRGPKYAREDALLVSGDGVG